MGTEEIETQKMQDELLSTDDNYSYIPSHTDFMSEDSYNITGNIPVNLNGKNPSFINHAENVNHISGGINLTDSQFIRLFDVSKNKTDDDNNTQKSDDDEDTEELIESFFTSIREHRRIRRVKKAIIYSIICICFVVLIILGFIEYTHLRDNRKTLLTYINTGQVAYNEGDYAEAAKQFKIATAYTSSSTEKKRIICYEANCYYQIALSAQDVTSSTNNYKICSQLYSGIIKDDPRGNTIYDIVARAMLSNIFLETHHSMNDPQWKSLISNLESSISGTKYNSDSSEDVSYLICSYMSIILYYTQNDTAEFPVTFFPNKRNAIQQYYNKILELMESSNEYSSVINAYNTVEILSKAENIMVDAAVYSEASDEKKLKALSNILETCDNILSEYQYAENTAPLFLALKHIKCKCYFYMATLDTDDKFEYYKESMYKEVHPFLILSSLDDYSLLTELQLICFYASASQKCTATDIDNINNILSTYYKACSTSSETIQSKIMQLYITCGICQNILENYGYNEGIYSTGLTAATFIYNNCDLFSENFLSKEYLNEFYYYFADYQQ